MFGNYLLNFYIYELPYAIPVPFSANYTGLRAKNLRIREAQKPTHPTHCNKENPNSNQFLFEYGTSKIVSNR
jgi:hypothetical protein